MSEAKGEGGHLLTFVHDDQEWAVDADGAIWSPMANGRWMCCRTAGSEREARRRLARRNRELVAALRELLEASEEYIEASLHENLTEVVGGAKHAAARKRNEDASARYAGASYNAERLTQEVK